MCTIIKVKRKITEDPVDCLIIECKKKKKLDEGNGDSKINNNNNMANGSSDPHSSPIKQILKYVGSATNEDEIPVRIKEFKNSGEKTETTRMLKKKQLPTPTTKSKKQNESSSTEARNYVVVGKKRDVNAFTDTDENKGEKKRRLRPAEGNDEVNIIDAISSDDYNLTKEKNSTNELLKQQPAAEKISCNGMEMVREKVVDYVYDLYFTKANDIRHLDLLYPNSYEIKSYAGLYEDDSELIDENNHDGEDEKEMFEDDEDSNEESNWRNDYPDDDDDENEEIDDDIDEEDDEIPSTAAARYYNYVKNTSNRSQHYEDEDDDYNEYGNDYNNDDDDYNGKKLASYMKKSLILDRSRDDDDDDDNLDNEYRYEDLEKSYIAYKKKILKELKADYNEDI